MASPLGGHRSRHDAPTARKLFTADAAAAADVDADVEGAAYVARASRPRYTAEKKIGGIVKMKRRREKRTKKETD